LTAFNAFALLLPALCAGGLALMMFRAKAAENPQGQDGLRLVPVKVRASRRR